jgi:hypothetical protein
MFITAFPLEGHMNNKNHWESPEHNINVRFLNMIRNAQSVEMIKIRRYEMCRS